MPRPNAGDGKEAQAEQHPPTRKIIKTKAGHTIQMEDKDGAEMVTIIEKEHGHVITMNDQGITITDGLNDNSITMGAGRIELNGGKRICLEGLIDWLDKHQHSGNMGAPTPLDPFSKTDLQTQKDNLLSTRVTAE